MRTWVGRPSTEGWRNGGIITGERELPGREISDTGEEEEMPVAKTLGSAGLNCERGSCGSPEVKKPT